MATTVAMVIVAAVRDGDHDSGGNNDGDTVCISNGDGNIRGNCDSG